MTRPGPKRSPGLERRVTFTPDTELHALLVTFADVEGVTMPEAAKTLIRMALAATPQRGLFDARQRRIMHEMRIWFLNRLGRACREVEDELKGATAALPPEDLPTLNP